MVNLSKYKQIINTLKELGFHSFYQVGTINKFHELNLIVENPIQNRLYWITKSFGEFVLIYRDGVNDSRAKQYRFKCENQKEICERLQELISQ